MAQGWCATTFLFRIQQGNSDGVNLGNLDVIMVSDFPGPTLFDGNGTPRVYLSEGASADQRRELEAIFQGRKGGPMEIVGSLVTRWLPTEATRIDVQEQGDTVNAAVGDFGQVQSQRLRNEAGQPMTMQNVGMAGALQFDNQVGELAPSSGTRWSDPDLPRPLESKSGVVASFRWGGS